MRVHHQNGCFPLFRQKLREGNSPRKYSLLGRFRNCLYGKDLPSSRLFRWGPNRSQPFRTLRPTFYRRGGAKLLTTRAPFSNGKNRDREVYTKRERAIYEDTIPAATCGQAGPDVHVELAPRAWSLSVSTEPAWIPSDAGHAIERTGFGYSFRLPHRRAGPFGLYRFCQQAIAPIPRICSLWICPSVGNQPRSCYQQVSRVSAVFKNVVIFHATKHLGL